MCYATSEGRPEPVEIQIATDVCCIPNPNRAYKICDVGHGGESGIDTAW